MSWARSWIACVAFAYPLYLAEIAAVTAFPALVESLFPGHELVEIGFRHFALFAISTPEPSLVTRIVCVLVVASIICWILRRCEPCEVHFGRRLWFLIAGFVVPIALFTLMN
jgi:hypothetical protein